MITLIILGLTIGVSRSSGQSLGPFRNVDDSSITISGFSSGGTFCQQLQFSYPSYFTGIAVFSHTYYRCGPANGIQADYDRVCTRLANATESELYDPERVHDDIRNYESRNLIGKTSSLKDKRLYVFTGLRNFLFSPAMSMNILRVYERYIRNPQAIRTRVMDAALVMPTNKIGAVACTAGQDEGDDFLADCGFSGAYEALRFLLGDKVSHRPHAHERIALEPLQQFSQQEFTDGIENHQLDTTGYYYVPKECRGRRKCLLHFFFHGCLNGREFVQDRFIKGSGYLEVAELNKIIMVFPQVKASEPENGIGCWDTFGISGSRTTRPLYATREGAQVKAVKRMIDKIIGSSSASSLASSNNSPQYPSFGWTNNKGYTTKP